MIYNALISFLFKLIQHLSSSLKPLILIFVIAYILSYFGIAEKSESLGENTYRYIWFLAFENLFVTIPGELTGSYSTFANFIVYITLFSAVLSKLFKGALHSTKIKIVTKINHNIVIGLGENNRRYLNSELSCGNENTIVIIESNKNNIHIEEFKDKGFVVFIGTLDTYKINYRTLEHVVISTGNDRMNIEVAGMLINKIPKGMSKDKFGNATVVHVHLNNSNYKALFQQKILSVNNNLPLDFKIYSFYENAVKELFEGHTILGNYYSIASKSSSYNIILVGDGRLAEVMVYHLCLLSSLPNKNHLTIHCMGENSTKFIQKLHVNYTELSKIKTISFVSHEESISKLEFYRNKVWLTKNLTNIIVCDDDENTNLELVVNLHDKVYLKQSIQKTMKTKILFAMYSNLELGKAINKNSEEFREYYTFGDAQIITHRKFLIDEKYEKIAKLVHFGYAERYNKDMLLSVNDKNKKEEISEKWHDSTTLNKRESNRSQALHINTKLMSLGLKKISSSESDEDLLLHNQKILKIHKDDFALRWRLFKIIKWRKSKPDKYNDIEIHFDINKEINSLSSKLYSENSLEQSDLEDFFKFIIQSNDNYSKLVIAEHERWNIFHYLNGWTYDDNGGGKSQVKEHNCLLPMEEFSNIGIQQTVIYDLYSILYLPNYLASTGYRIVPIEDISIGIIDNRDIKDIKLQHTLTKELKKIIASYGKIELVSSLAEGADHFFIDKALEIDSDKVRKLTVPMPFDKEDYLKDFKTYASKGKVIKYLVLNKIYPHISTEVYFLSEGNPRKQKKAQEDKANKLVSWWDILKDKEKMKNQQKNYDNDQYTRSRHKVINKSDILFAIWDGTRTQEVDDTAKAIDYAISKRKKIIWINPDTNEVNSSSYPYISSIKVKSDKL